MENQKRILSLLIVFVVLFVVVIIRLVDLQIIRHNFYEKISHEQRTRLINLAAQRGDILDRNGDLLATSIDSYSVYEHRKGWLQRKLALSDAQKYQKEDPKNLSIIKEKKRVYPKNNLAAQIIGFVGVDNQGLSGFEGSCDEFLRGQEGRLITESDPRGRELYGALRELRPGVDGMQITLTIDQNIQYVAERELERQIKETRAKSGMCIVMDAQTGELLALASKPDFNPNAYSKYDRKLWHPRYLDPFEPGSTFKVITVAAALEQGAATLKTRLKSMDRITVGGKVIENSHKIDWPGRTVSISEMLEQSINTCSAQLGLLLGPNHFYNYIKAFGFGQRTDFGLWGESRGILRHWKRWYKPDIGMISFGQSIAVTPLQLISAFSVFANQGVLVKPILIKRIESNDGKFIKVFAQDKKERVISAKVADQVKGLMRNVVLKGTGKKAEIENFAVCGKTGTAQKVAPNGRGYMKDRYITSFIGFAPFDNPRVITLVIVDEPRTSIWAETVCAPVFKEVTEYTLRYFNAKPDML